MTELLRRTRWLWVGLFAVLLVAEGFVANSWAARQSQVPASDCAVVGQLGRQWVAVIRYTNNDSEGSRRQLLIIADVEGALSERIRAAQSEVSDSRIKPNLRLWADATGEMAELQRSVLTDDPGDRSQESDDAQTAEQVRIAKKIFRAILPLSESCPNARFQ